MLTKFVQEHIKSVTNAHVLARKAANTLHNAGECADIGSRLVGPFNLYNQLEISSHQVC